MLSWLRKAVSDDELDLSFLTADLHSHLIPGIDDGVQTVEEAVAMAQRMQTYGYKRLMTTPHVIWDCYRNTPDTIQRGLEQVQQACAEAGLHIRVEAAAEYFLDEHFNRMLVTGERLLTLPQNRLLVELPYTTPLRNVSHTLFSIIEHGYTPVLAHPERYSYYHHTPDVYHKLAGQGCELQLNALSLTGYYGEEVGRVAAWLLKEKLIVYIGTDAHRLQHLYLLRKIRTSKWLSTYPFQNAALFA